MKKSIKTEIKKDDKANLATKKCDLERKIKEREEVLRKLKLVKQYKSRVFSYLLTNQNKNLEISKFYSKI
jgi:hypothetical protein